MICPKCGKIFHTRFCPNCSYKADADTWFEDTLKYPEPNPAEIPDRRFPLRDLSLKQVTPKERGIYNPKAGKKRREADYEVFEPSKPTVSVTTSSAPYRPRPVMPPQQKFTSNIPAKAGTPIPTPPVRPSTATTTVGTTGTSARTTTGYVTPSTTHTSGRFTSTQTYGRYRTQTATKSSPAGKIVFLFIILVIGFNVLLPVLKGLDIDFSDDTDSSYSDSDYGDYDDYSSYDGYSGITDAKVVEYGSTYSSDKVELSINGTFEPEDIDAGDGYSAVGVSLYVHKLNDESESFYISTDDFILYTDTGFNCSNITPDNIRATTDDSMSNIATGEVMTIQVYFRVPEDQSIGSVLYNGNSMNDTPAELMLR